jgi:AcrR family transcriptional regulator
MMDTFDHRPEVAERRRLLMRTRILEATARTFTARVSAIPGIEDVAREAGISRGTFYRYFDSLDSAVVAAGVAMSDGLMTDILPVYDFLKEPWQRFSVGFRLYLVRSLLDPKHTEFLIRMDVWPQGSLVDKYMSGDLRMGRDCGQFEVDNVEAATDFLKGASAGTIQAVRRGVPEPESYIDAAVHMGLRSLGCTVEMCSKGVEFSRTHVARLST